MGGIFRFGDPAADKWMTDLMARRIQDWQVDIFRMDHNTNPVPFWRDADTPDRQGITEIRQIEGLYAMWDGLLQRFPHLVIDNANWRETGPDIEAMRRTLGSLDAQRGHQWRGAEAHCRPGAYCGAEYVGAVRCKYFEWSGRL